MITQHAIIHLEWCFKRLSENNSVTRHIRYTEQFKTGKTSGVMAGKFYSCDNNLLGYLAIKIDDLYLIYQEIPSRIWKEFSGSNDLDAYYLEHIRGSYTVLAREE